MGKQNRQTSGNSHSWTVGEEGLAEDANESLRSKLPPYGLLSSSFHMAPVLYSTSSATRAGCGVACRHRFTPIQKSKYYCTQCSGGGGLQWPASSVVCRRKGGEQSIGRGMSCHSSRDGTADGGVIGAQQHPRDEELAGVVEGQGAQGGRVNNDSGNVSPSQRQEGWLRWCWSWEARGGGGCCRAGCMELAGAGLRRRRQAEMTTCGRLKADSRNGWSLSGLCNPPQLDVCALPSRASSINSRI